MRSNALVNSWLAAAPRAAARSAVACVFSVPRKALLDNHISPLAVQLSMLLIDADFPKPKRTNQSAAGHIFGKDTRHELPVSRTFRSRDERLEDGSACARLRSLRATYTDTSAIPW